jgi:hypothetical protein
MLQCVERLVTKFHKQTSSFKMSASDKIRKWYHITWFQDYDTPEERKLIVKLDLLIVPYVFVVFLISSIMP